MLKSIEQGKSLAARYLPPRQLCHVIPLLLACTHIEHAVGSTHRPLRKRRRFHSDVGDAFQPFATGRMVPGGVSCSTVLQCGRGCGQILPLDRAFHRAEVAGTTCIGKGDEAGWRQVARMLQLLLLLLLLCTRTSG